MNSRNFRKNLSLLRLPKNVSRIDTIHCPYKNSMPFISHVVGPKIFISKNVNLQTKSRLVPRPDDHRLILSSRGSTNLSRVGDDGPYSPNSPRNRGTGHKGGGPRSSPTSCGHTGGGDGPEDKVLLPRPWAPDQDGLPRRISHWPDSDLLGSRYCCLLIWRLGRRGSLFP